MKTARRGERRIFNFIENSQGPGASAGVQDAPRSVPSGSEEDFPCINFATHLVETPKSVAVKTGLKMGLKNDEKMAPRWGQNGGKNWYKLGFGNEVHLGRPCWTIFWSNIGNCKFEPKVRIWRCCPKIVKYTKIKLPNIKYF